MQPVSNNAVRVAALQCVLGDDATTNCRRIADLIEAAPAPKPQIICLPELLEGPYFCQTQNEADFRRAQPLADNPTVKFFQQLASQQQICLTVPFFERDGTHYYNSVAVVDADGTLVKNDRGSFVYRKSHIPQGPGYEEKFFFRPGNTGFTTWPTRQARLGIGICWDQWFPEAARVMTLRGAQLLLYPTAIGSEPTDATLDTQAEWQLAMRGHAVHNRIVVVAANRIGQEGDARFYGSSFIAGPRGQLLQSLGRDEAGLIATDVQLDALTSDRAVWGFFRDRRPDLYGELTELH